MHNITLHHLPGQPMQIKYYETEEPKAINYCSNRSHEEDMIDFVNARKSWLSSEKTVDVHPEQYINFKAATLVELFKTDEILDINLNDWLSEGIRIDSLKSRIEIKEEFECCLKNESCVECNMRKWIPYATLKPEQQKELSIEECVKHPLWSEFVEWHNSKSGAVRIEAEQPPVNEAVEFGEYLRKNYITTPPTTALKVKWIKAVDFGKAVLQSGQYYTTAELYEIFKQSKK